MILSPERPTRRLLDVELRFAQDVPADAEAFCTLSNSLYNRKVSPAYYRWQFFQTPFPTVLAFATTKNHQLAGCYGIQVRDSSLGPQSMAMALDIMVAPPFQGHGLFRRLADYACAPMSAYRPTLVFVLANERADTAHVKGLGWTSVQVLHDSVRSTAGARKQITGKVMGTPIQRFSDQDRLVLAHSTASAKASQEIRLCRSPRYLQWRLLDNARYVYQIFRCTTSGKCIGFLALKVFRDPATGAVYGDIVDVIRCDEDAALTAEMLVLALAEFECRGVPQATIWLASKGPLDEVGRSLGFRRVARPRYLSCRLLAKEPSWALDARHWSLAMMDTDVY